MKKRHIIIVFVLVPFLLMGWIPIIYNLYTIYLVKNHPDRYTIVNAQITKCTAVAKGTYVAYIVYDFNGVRYNDRVEYGIVDMYSNEISIAVENDSLKIARTKLAIDYSDIAVTFALLLCMFGEFIRYANEKKRWIQRKTEVRDVNQVE